MKININKSKKEPGQGLHLVVAQSVKEMEGKDKFEVHFTLPNFEAVLKKVYSTNLEQDSPEAKELEALIGKPLSAELAPKDIEGRKAIASIIIKRGAGGSPSPWLAAIIAVGDLARASQELVPQLKQ